MTTGSLIGPRVRRSNSGPLTPAGGREVPGAITCGVGRDGTWGLAVRVRCKIEHHCRVILPLQVNNVSPDGFDRQETQGSRQEELLRVGTAIHGHADAAAVGKAMSRFAGGVWRKYCTRVDSDVPAPKDSGIRVCYLKCPTKGFRGLGVGVNTRWPACEGAWRDGRPVPAQGYLAGTW